MTQHQKSQRSQDRNSECQFLLPVGTEDPSHRVVFPHRPSERITEGLQPLDSAASGKLCVKSTCCGAWQGFIPACNTVGKFHGSFTRVNNHSLDLLVSTKELWNRSLCLLHYLLTRSLRAQSSSGNYYQVRCKGRRGSDDLNYYFFFFFSRKWSIMAPQCNTHKKNIHGTNEAFDYQMRNIRTLMEANEADV